MSESRNVKNVVIPILCGSNFNLELIDLSFKNISIMDIQTDVFKDYINKYSPPEEMGYNYSELKNIFKDIHGEYDKKFAIVPTDPINNYNEQDIYNAWIILLIIHPSDLQIEYELNYYIDGDYLHTSGYSMNHRRFTGDFPGKPLINSEELIPEINEFIKRVFMVLSKTDYLGLCIFNYIISYEASHEHYQFMSLFTALDSLINNESELQYRLKRGVAILCGSDSKSSDLIFEKVSKLVKLRNDIVHGNEYAYGNLINYLPHLRTLVSRVIIELLIHNITKQELNDAFKRLGFGQRHLISENWKEYTLNTLSELTATWESLPEKIKISK